MSGRRKRPGRSISQHQLRLRLARPARPARTGRGRSCVPRLVVPARARRRSRDDADTAMLATALEGGRNGSKLSLLIRRHLLHNVVLTAYVSSKRIQNHVQSSAPAPPSACSQISDLNLSLGAGLPPDRAIGHATVDRFLLL